MTKGVSRCLLARNNFKHVFQYIFLIDMRFWDILMRWRHSLQTQVSIYNIQEECFLITENVLDWVQEGGWIELWKIFPNLDVWKIVFAIWKTLMNLGAKDIGCNKEINWFKAQMNQFVIKTDISTQQILNHTKLQFHTSTLSRSSLHSFNNSIH